MRLLVITFSTNSTNPGLIHLVNSLKRNCYNYHVLVGEQFSWGGNNYLAIAHWLKQNRGDYTHILYTDAWDTLAMAPVDEFAALNENVWLFSAEKNPCFAGNLSKYQSASRWKYLCAGGYLAPIDFYIEVVESEPRLANENDQQWASRIFETGKYPVALDTGCRIFQTLYNMGPFNAAPNWGEFAVSDEGRLVNLITGTKPIFIHGNGKVDMRSIYHHPYLMSPQG